MNMLGHEGVNRRNRGSAVLINEDKVALIKRTRDGEEYYVFPGGGIEKGESPEQATIREAFEELGLKIDIKEQLGIVEFKGEQHYFIAEMVGGIFGTGEGEEYGKDRNRGRYEPMWIPVAKLDSLDVRPMEIAKRLIERMEI